MSIFTKEFRILYGNKIFLMCIVFFSLLYCALGYGAKFVYEQVVTDINVIYYFLFIYSMSLTLIMLQVYPVSNEIREQANGGVENILATGYPLQKLIFYKIVGLFCAIYLPSAIMVVIIVVWSKLFLAGLLALVVILPVINGGLALIYTCTIFLSSNPGMVIRQLSFYATGGIFLLSYGPVIIYKITGYIVDIKISITLSILFSLIIGINSYHKYKEIDVEKITIRGDYL